MNDEVWQNQIFDKNAKAIHEMHIRQAENTELEIATKRIEKYFDGKLPLTWKGIIYEINKLPELDRNKYFKDLCETEILKAKISATKETYDSILPILKKYKRAWTILAIANAFLVTVIIFITLFK